MGGEWEQPGRAGWGGEERRGRGVGEGGERSYRDFNSSRKTHRGRGTERRGGGWGRGRKAKGRGGGGERRGGGDGLPKASIRG